MRTIVLLTGNHLCHNPRVLKEATTLAHAGFEVKVLGAWIDPMLKGRDQQLISRVPFKFLPVIDLTGHKTPVKLQRLAYRLRTKAGHNLFRIGGVQNRWQVGYAVSALGRAARFAKGDLSIAHSESAAVVARDLLVHGRRVGVDMEDWFSEDLLPAARRHRPIKLLRHLEQNLLGNAAHASCPSRAMSQALAAEFGCRPPAVIYNAFEWRDRRLLDGELKDRKDRRVPSVHWYSQTLGQGRGLEDLFAALPHLKQEVEIHLRGKLVSGFDDWLNSHVPGVWWKRIFIHNLVSNEELLSRIAEHDIGFAGEMKFCRSRNLTVTNKILHYLLGGLAVVASDTAGQHEVAKQASGAVRLFRSGDPQSLAEQLNLLLASPSELRAAKASALIAAEQTFCWERQVPTLLRSVEKALVA
jgi:glycosyltransferase involved in cell wall biosynthesis